MIDKVIKLKDGLDYYVLDEFVKDKRVFLFAIQVDNTEDIVTDNCIVCEMRYKNNQVVIDNLKDLKEQEEINNMFLSRMKDK